MDSLFRKISRLSKNTSGKASHKDWSAPWDVIEEYKLDLRCEFVNGTCVWS